MGQECRCGGENMPPPPYIHILVPEYVTLHGPRDLADAIKLRILRWEIVLDDPLGPMSSPGSL